MQFYANSYAFVSVLLIVLELAILAAMWRVENKSTATRFLFAFFVCLLFNSLAMFWSNAGPVYRFIFIPTQDAFLIAGGVGLIGFTYHYPRYNQPREARWMLAVFSAAALAAFAYNFYFAYLLISQRLAINPPFYFALLMPITLLLGILVIFRRAVHYAGPFSQSGLKAGLGALWRPPNQQVLVLRNFALAVAVGSIQAVASAGFVTGILNIHFIAIGAILAISAIALAYFTHAPEPVSFMSKLVGISLVTLLIVLGIDGVNHIEARRAEQRRLTQELAATALTVVLSNGQPALIPPGVRYIISWPNNNSPNATAYQLHYEGNDEPLARPGAMMADNIKLLEQGEIIEPSVPDRPGFIFRDLLPSPIDYARITAVQILREGRVYEVGFLNADNFLLPVHIETMWQIVMVIISSLFVIIFFPLFFRRALLTPLKNLLHGVQQADAGRLDITVPVLYDDELGVLARSFNRMVGSLRQSQTSLQQFARILEEKVKLRTTELTAANEELERRNNQFQQINQNLAREIAERRQVEQMLQQSQQRYSVATQAARVGVWDWNLQTSEFFLDPNIKAILGYSDAEIPNDLEVWTTYIHPDDLQPVMEAAQAHLNGQTPEYIFEHRMLHKDGSVRWILVRGKVIQDEQGQAVRLVGTDTDITERKEAEAREHRQHQIAESLQQVALILNRTLDQKQVVAAVLNQLQAIIPHDGATVWLVEGEKLIIVEGTGLSLRRVGWSIPLASNSPQALAVRNRQPRISANVNLEPEWPPWDKEALIHSWLGVPMIAGQQVLGLLSLVRGEMAAYDREDLLVLQSFANQAVTAISNARLYQQANTAHERLAILYQASQVISAASLVPQQIYANIHAAVAQLMPADVFVVTLIDETAQEAEDIYLIDQGQIGPSRRYPLPGTFAHYLLRRGASLRADDYSAIPQEEFKFELFGSPEDTRSGLAVLLRGRDRVLGLLSVQSYELATYTGDELEMLELLAAHAAIALENTRLYQQAQTAAALEERNRLARDLHDSVTQSLYSLTLLAEGWRRLAQRGRLADLDSALTELGEIAQQSLKEMRLLIYELRPPVLEQAGLLGALHQRLDAVERRAGIEARLIAEDLIKLPPPLEQGLYRITQEALTNALKHARATTVTVFVRTRGEWIEIEIDDNGCGFEPERLNGQSGLGLISMRERAEQLGGELVIESKPGMGTTVKAKVKGNS